MAGMEREQSGVGTRGSRGVTGGGRRRGELAAGAGAEAGAGAGAHHQVHVDVAAKYHGLDLDPGLNPGLGQCLAQGLGQLPEAGGGNLAGPAGGETGDGAAVTDEGTGVGMGTRGGIEGTAAGLARVRVL